MQKFNNLYTFVEFAKNNRKYPQSTANNLKSALKIFEKVLTDDELASVDLIKDRIEEIFINIINNNKDKSIGSLNTYKARVLKVLNDYKKYGEDPTKIQSWIIKSRNSLPDVRQVHQFTGVLNKKDKPDKNLSELSDTTHNHVNNVHRIELALDSNSKAVILIPRDITISEANTIKVIIDSLVKK